jgi:hypothetical protein
MQTDTTDFVSSGCAEILYPCSDQANTRHLADIIDSKTQEIRPQDDEIYSKMEDLADDLPDSSPRFILLSYPLTTVSCPK